jgi:hypothetical protein
MVWACLYVAVWVSLVIYLITQHTIDRREERQVILKVILTSQIILQHGQGIQNKSEPTDV